MPSQSNLRYVEDLKQALDGFQSLVFMSFEGVPHRDFERLRDQFRQQKGRFQIVKNRLLKVALEELSLPVPADSLVGPTAMGVAYQDPSVSAKLLLDFIRNHPACAIKGGILEQSPLDAAGVEALSRMPSREETLAQVVAMLGSPVALLTRMAAAPVALLSRLQELDHSQEAA